MQHVDDNSSLASMRLKILSLARGLRFGSSLLEFVGSDTPPQSFRGDASAFASLTRIVRKQTSPLEHRMLGGDSPAHVERLPWVQHTQACTAVGGPRTRPACRQEHDDIIGVLYHVVVVMNTHSTVPRARVGEFKLMSVGSVDLDMYMINSDGICCGGDDMYAM